ncbi:MAG: PP2C family protein-serine/threonine phosphatase [Flavobacteriales bacterium]
MAQISRLAEKVRQRDFKLNALLEITKAINANLPVEGLLSEYERVLRDELSIQKLILYTKVDLQWSCLLEYGIPDGLAQNIADESFFQTNEIALSVGRRRESFDLVIPVHHEDQPIAYLLVGDEKEEELKISPVIKHMRFIETLTNVLVVAIENRKLGQEKIRQERVKKELELAAEMQAILLPQQLPKNNEYEVSAVYKAHQQVGGDYYDFLELNDDEVMFCMADVSGKGVSAAFLMANFQAYLRSIFAYSKGDLSEIVIELNNRVMHSAMGEKYITLFLATYHKPSRRLKYINCGHNPPVLADENGYTQLLKLGSIGLGMFEELPKVAMGELILQRNSLVVCYTDGLVETENEANEEFGLERLEKVILENFGDSVSELTRNIVVDVNHHRGEMPFIDDLAILSCRFF